MKTVREVYLHAETHLPIHGWLQGCWLCDTITSKTKERATIHKVKRIYKFIVYMCPPCRRKIDNGEKIRDFNTKCNEFIIDYLSTCRT